MRFHDPDVSESLGRRAYEGHCAWLDAEIRTLTIGSAGYRALLKAYGNHAGLYDHVIRSLAPWEDLPEREKARYREMGKHAAAWALRQPKEPQ